MNLKYTVFYDKVDGVGNWIGAARFVLSKQEFERVYRLTLIVEASFFSILSIVCIIHPTFDVSWER